MTRRSFLAGMLAAPLTVQGAPVPRDWRKYLDPATEFEVLLLTDPQHESIFPSPPAIAVDRRSRLLLYASTRSGQWQPWVMDLSDGTSRQLGTHTDFLPSTMTLHPAGREAVLAEGSRLKAVRLAGLRQRPLASLTGGAEWFGPVAPSPDGTALFYVEKAAGLWRVQRLAWPKGAPATVLESGEPVLALTPNPRRSMLLWRTEAGAIETAAQDGTLRRRLETPPGRVLEAAWSPDGQAVLYLHESAEERPRCTLREQMLDSREDRLVAPTSQFGRFSRNANGSVFVGASRSAASPLILILLRINRRELPLCEHKASDPQMTRPVFTPDSQRILFVSDRLGKPAIFMLNVEKLIEKTES